MPLSPNVQRIADAMRAVNAEGVVVFEVPANSTDDQVLSLAADRFALLGPKFDEQHQEITALSADVERLTGELTTANATKATLQLAADAAPKPFDPLAAEQLGEMVDATFEQAIAAGLPAKAVEALRPALRDDRGGLTVFALSGCSVPAEGGKVKASRNALVVANVFKGLAEGKFGQGVTLGPAKAKPVLQASAEPEGEKTLAQAAVEVADATIKKNYPSATVK